MVVVVFVADFHLFAKSQTLLTYTVRLRRLTNALLNLALNEAFNLTPDSTSGRDY